MPNVCIASIWHVGLSRHICAVDLGPMGRCGPEAKEQKNGRQWDVENRHRVHVPALLTVALGA